MVVLQLVGQAVTLLDVMALHSELLNSATGQAWS